MEITNGTITIIKANSTITLENVTMDYGETVNISVATTGAKGITAKIDDADVEVIDDFTVPISGLNAGNYTLTVTTIPDDDHNPVTKTVNITVNKVDSTLTVEDIVFDYNSTGSTVVSFTGADGVNASVVDQPDAVVIVNGINITVSGLNAGTYNLTVTTMADVNHNNVTKNATITLNKLKTELTGAAVTATYNVNKDLVITLKDIKGNVMAGANVTVVLNGAKNYTTDANGQIKVATIGLAPDAYTAKVTFAGDANHDNSTVDIKVTVKKAIPKITANKKTFKTTKKTKKYTVILKDNTGKAIKNAKVTLKVCWVNSISPSAYEIKNAKVTLKGYIDILQASDDEESRMLRSL